jgi:hypothetical protein
MMGSEAREIPLDSNVAASPAGRRRDGRRQKRISASCPAIATIDRNSGSQPILFRTTG